MRVLLVSNEGPRPNRVGNPIIERLITGLNHNSEVDEALFCPFANKLSDFRHIRKMAKSVDLIHIQFGGLYALLIWISLIGIPSPKLLTFHGTDIHAKEIRTTHDLLVKSKIWLNQKASFLSLALFDRLGFVTSALLDYIPKRIRKWYSNKFFIQPLGVDYSLFQPMSITEACAKLQIPCANYVLFSDKSGTAIKRRDLSEAIVSHLGDNYKLLVMCGVSPNSVPIYINAASFVILTSDEEGSPNIIREALSLNKRVFSVDVGDVKEQLDGLSNSAIISRNPSDAASQILKIIDEPYVDNTRESLYSTNNLESTVSSLVLVYHQVLHK